MDAQRGIDETSPESEGVERSWRFARLSGSALCALGAGFGMPAMAGNLPVPCIASGSCGVTGPASWVGSGAATATQTANKLTVNQTSQNVLLNWQSFNIGADSSVNFVQPNAQALAINKIFQGSPSQILGSLTANGRIYLINQNGIVFGSGAQVNAAGLVASSLNITQDAIDKGIAGTVVGDPTTASFVPFQDSGKNTLPSGDVKVLPGAKLNSNGGQIFLFAPNVSNEGTITTPNGQTILAAGSSIYLATSDDPNVRGLTVAVDAGGTVTNGNAGNAAAKDPSQLVGKIVAQHGNVTLMGLAVNQQGLVSANTSVQANGTILLVAADRQKAGTVTLGPNSVTEAPLDTTDTSLAVDQTLQQKSAVDIQGDDVNVDSGSSITATSGSVNITAVQRAISGSVDVYRQGSTGGPTASLSDGSRLYIADDATIDVSGATATLPMSANTLQVELRGSELADDPLQRNGALRGQTVTVDTRQYGTAADGSVAWLGTPLANLSGDFATIQHGILERNETGGSVALQSYGDVIVGSNSRVNVSGGASNYQAGFLNTSALIGANGQLYSISNASPNTVYSGIANTTSLTIQDNRWGVNTTYYGIYGTGQGQYVPGYVQGADAGSLALNAPHVIFDGSLIANVQAGPYQRKPPTTTAATLINGRVRPYDQLALPGQLTLGSVNPSGQFPDEILSSVVLASGATLPTLENPDGTAFNPLTDPWPAGTAETAIPTVLNPALIGPNAAGRVTLDANGEISIPAGVRLQLPAGGNFNAQASNITVAGRILGSGGAISLKAAPTVGATKGSAGITLGSAAVLDVAGAWVNDNPALANNPATAPLTLKGGSVSLTAVDGDITLASGSLIDVSGGAQLQANGALAAGVGGSITINASAPDYLTPLQPLQPTQVSLGATLRGYGISQGGSLNVSAGSFCLTSGASCAPLSADLTGKGTNGVEGTRGTLTLDPSFFTTGGFSSFGLNANFGGLEVTSGTVIQPVQSNFLAPGSLLPSAATLSSVASTAVLPEVLRQPVSVALSAQYVSQSPGNLGQTFAVNAAEFAAAPSLSIDAGASLILDPQAKLTLQSNTRILDDGLIRAPSGSVTMTVNNLLPEQELIKGHQLWLGPHALIDASGTTQAQLDASGHTVGSVLPGGSVTLLAQRGAVETEPGSLINVSGTSATLDIQQVDSSGAGRFVPTVVASAGGSVNVQAAAAAVLSGSMLATGGNSTVPAGSFSLVMDNSNRYGPSLGLFFTVPEYPQDWGYDALTIRLQQSPAPIVVAANANLPDGLVGQGFVSAASLASAGFDAVGLKAATVDPALAQAPSTVARQPGRIEFGSGVQLTLGRSLTLDAGDFVSTGGTATLSAPYVSLGQSSTMYQLTPSQVDAGTGSLRINGGLIDLIGASAFAGFADVTLNSSGDIRGTGIEPPQPNVSLPPAAQSVGSLSTSGALDLVAQQIYPSTLTSFTFTSGASGVGDISIGQAHGTAPATLLSAGGTVTFNAPTVTQAGTVRAPLGSVVINASNITLAQGSTTSTSADGQIIPFGTTQGGFDWVYPVSGGTLVYGTKGGAFPSQSIQLSGNSVNIAKGAVVDVKGGGDLFATEFVPGPTGTQDVLGSGSAFAILPTSNLQYAPIDPYYATNSSAFPGETVYLSGSGGVPAGTYAVLPARYALLPGAFYVTPVSGYQDLTLGQHLSQPDGTVIVSGYMGYAGTSLGNSRTSGFDIRLGGYIPGLVTTAQMQTSVQNLAQYSETSANNFFAAQAATANVQVQRLPRDAGHIELSATSQLTLQGTLEASPGRDGRGAAVDISSSAIRVVNGSNATGSQTNVLDLDADSLSQLGAESILIGGVRSQTATGLQIATRASSVEVTGGADLKAPELLLTATNSVAVDGGATLGSSGSLPTSDKSLLLSGDGVLLRVAASGSPTTLRTGGAQGALALMSGSTIDALGGSVTVDTAGTADFGGTLQLNGGSLAIAGKHISLGDAIAGTDGVVLPATTLNTLSVANLSLSSQTSIDFYDGSSLSGTNISLTAGALLGGKGTTSAVQVNASGQLTLQGSADNSSVAGTGLGTGQIALTGESVTLDKGLLDLSGFTSVSLSSRGLLKVSGAGGLSVEQSNLPQSAPADLNITAGLLSADSGATRTLSVSGAFTYNPAASPAQITLPSETSLGATLAITAQSVAFNGAATLNAGELDLTAKGPVSLGATAAIDLSAVSTAFNGLSVPSPAGILNLRSTAGSISALAGSNVNVSGLDDSVANSGLLSVSAPSGSVSLAGRLAGRNADVNVDGQSLGDTSTLEASLVNGGFTGSWNLRLRGPGDLVVPANSANAIVGRSVRLTADQGSVDVEGTITSHGASGGAITLCASRDVVVNGTLDARPTGAGQMNGQVELATTSGRVLVGPGATIEAYDPSVSAQSLQDGGLWIRAPQDTVNTLLPGSSSSPGLVLGGDLTRLSSLTIEGVGAPATPQTPGTLDESDLDAAMSQAAGFMSNAPALSHALATIKGPSVQIVPGIEIDSNQSLSLDTAWDLSQFRPGGVAGALTVRTTGDLSLNGSISDGFAGASSYALNSSGPSWSYRLIGGADLSSSNVMAVQPLPTSSDVQPTGSVTLGAGTMVRTGTGSISIAAANDVTLTNETSVIYTAGIGESGADYPRLNPLRGLLYPTQGGDISISAGQDVGYTLGGEHVSNLVNAWLWRVGSETPQTLNQNQPVATAWTVNFAHFAQGIGALGGGNVDVTAGRNVMDLSVSVPTVGRQVGSSIATDSDVQILNQGNILVRAGNDVRGGSLYDGLGTAVMVAGNRITSTPIKNNQDVTLDLYPMVLLGDARAILSARSGATIAGVSNPTLLAQDSAENATRNTSYFSTYTPDSAFSLQTVSGTARLVNDTSTQSAVITNYNTLAFPTGTIDLGPGHGTPGLDGPAALRIYPGEVNVTSLRGDLSVNNSLTLFPEPNGNLNLLAHGDVQLGSTALSSIELTVSNADPSLLPTVEKPQSSFNNVQIELDSVLTYRPAKPSVNAPTPVHLTGATPDAAMSEIVSLTGDVAMLTTSESQITFAGPAQITAGRDLVDLQVDFKNLEATDVSSLVAGRDITYPLSRQANGLIDVALPKIDVEGPGSLEVLAGRDINLGTSRGITSQGNLLDPALSSTGASITLLAGLGDPLNRSYSTFITDYLAAPSSAYTNDLISYMTALMGTTPTASQALTAFEALPLSKQTPLVDTIFFDELRASGRAAAAAGALHSNFTRGYDAIQALFPDSVPILNGNKPSPYAGNISLYFSRVYTLDGGDIDLLSPGGFVNAGLATAPAAFGVNKAPSDLGIVAQTTGSVNAYTYGDFEVNQSRVFAADGGNILVWSTDGDIDAGRGSKTAISAPPPTITYDPTTGLPKVVFPAALTGSGIQTLATSQGVKPGDVDLFAPNGVVNANDAGIVAGNLTIAATAVLGASNIKVSGVAVGVPIEASGLGASLSGVSAVATESPRE